MEYEKYSKSYEELKKECEKARLNYDKLKEQAETARKEEEAKRQTILEKEKKERIKEIQKAYETFMNLYEAGLKDYGYIKLNYKDSSIISNLTPFGAIKTSLKQAIDYEKGKFNTLYWPFDF